MNGDARLDGVAPSMFAGHDVSCPYDETATAQRMGAEMPSMLAGRSMLRPYDR